MAENKRIYAEDLRQSIVDDKQIRGQAFAAIMRHIEAAPAVEAMPVVRGRWKGAGLGDYECTACWNVCSGGDRFNYCPWCGADMR